MNQPKRGTEDLQYDLCLGCAEKSPEGQGIIAIVTHHCPLNTVIYRKLNFKIRHFHQLLTGKSDMDSFKNLLYYPHFDRMPNFKTATESERRIYGYCRDTEISAMKRMRAYIELEEEFNSKY